MARWSLSQLSRAVASVLTIGLLIPQVAAADDAPAFSTALRRQLVLDTAPDQRFSIEERMRHYGVPGVSVAVVENCRVVEARGFGSATVDGRPVDAHTRFAAGSVSKVVASVGALALVQTGQLSLDEDISTRLRHWQLPRQGEFADSNVTLRNLLTHSAGLNVAGFKGYPRDQPLPSLEQILDGTAPANTPAVRIEAEPGKAWRYSGGGFVLTQLLMEDTTQQKFAPLMRDTVLAPAGMKESTYQQPLDAASARQAATGTLADGTPIPGGWRVYPEQAAAGLWSTPSDLARLGIDLVHSLRGKPGVLDTDMAKQMMQRQIGNWGLGVEVSPEGKPRKFSHTGAPVGYRTLWLMYPDTCQGAAIMTNADEGMTLTHEIARALADTWRWPDAAPSSMVTTSALTPEISARFVGEYQLRDFPAERFEVTVQPEGHLGWSRKGRGLRDLVAKGPMELVSPDSGMRLVATGEPSAQADTLELHFPGGVNVALRVKEGSR